MTPEQLKASILQYAIQGKLVEQRAEEGTAQELYWQIQEEKQKLVKEGKIKKEKPLAEITDDEIPFDISESWKWVKLGDCTGYAQTKEKISPFDIKPKMWSLDLEDIQKESGDIIVKILAADRKIIGDKVVFYKGQVLYSKLRPYLKKILVAPDNGICTPELVPFDTYGINPNYLVYVLKSPHIDNVINSVTYGVKMPRVGTDTMINLLIPLPPLAEQHRIVAKIEELLPYCDKLQKM
jgi:type I restriction enzyme S subunit